MPLPKPPVQKAALLAAADFDAQAAPKPEKRHLKSVANADLPGGAALDLWGRRGAAVEAEFGAELLKVLLHPLLPQHWKQGLGLQAHFQQLLAYPFAHLVGIIPKLPDKLFGDGLRRSSRRFPPWTADPSRRRLLPSAQQGC